MGTGTAARAVMYETVFKPRIRTRRAKVRIKLHSPGQKMKTSLSSQTRTCNSKFVVSTGRPYTAALDPEPASDKSATAFCHQKSPKRPFLPSYPTGLLFEHPYIAAGIAG